VENFDFQDKCFTKREKTEKEKKRRKRKSSASRCEFFCFTFLMIVFLWSCFHFSLFRCVFFSWFFVFF